MKQIPLSQGQYVSIDDEVYNANNRRREYAREYYKNRRKYDEEYRLKCRVSTKQWELRNIEQNRAYSRQWNRTHTEYHKEWKLFNRYGITSIHKQLLLILQNYKCNICSKDLKDSKNICVEHNHTTGIVRGIVCRTCNAQLAWYENNERAIKAHLKANPLCMS